jgi:hypothetical protein
MYAFTLAGSDVEAPRPCTSLSGFSGQFDHKQSIPRLPTQSAIPITASSTALITTSAQFANIRDWVLTAAQRGPLAIYPWYAAPGYMRCYFRISHPYMLPLPQGDPPRPCQLEANMEEEAQMEGLLTTCLDNTLTRNRGIADGLLASGELVEDSHALAEVKKSLALTTHYSHGYQRRSGGGPRSLCLYLWFMLLVECSDNFFVVWIILYFV